jgi:hypothetical protein
MQHRRDPIRNALAALLLVALTAACSDGTGRVPSGPPSGGDRYEAASDERNRNGATLAAVAAVVGLILLLVLSDDSSYSSGTLTAG